MLLLCSCLFGIFISYSGASVSLMIKDGVSSFQDGSEVVLICTISPYNNVMTWLVNNDPYADCFQGSCGPTPNKPFTFIFNFDESNGEFRLTIESVNTSHADQLFSCDDGSERKTITFNVTTRVNGPLVDDGQDCDEMCIVYICVGIIVFIIIVAIIACFKCVKPKFTKIELEDKEIYLEWTDWLNCCCRWIFKYNIVCSSFQSDTQGVQKQRQVTNEDTKEKHFILENLDPMVIYEISLSRKFCCFNSSAQQISVITRQSGMRYDQEYHAKSNSINVRWTKPDCISNPELQYQITCNKVEKGKQTELERWIKDLITYSSYIIEVFAIHNERNCLLFAEAISATPIKVRVDNVCYRPGKMSVECDITWTVLDKPDSDNGSDKFRFNVICRTKKEQKPRRENLNSSCTTLELFPSRSYTVYVFAIFNSIKLEPPVKMKLTPYKPIDKNCTIKSTVIVVNWEKPEYTENEGLQYKVICDKVEVQTSNKKTFSKNGLVPGKKYEIKVFTIIKTMKSQPLVKNITTTPVNVCLGVVSYDPERKCVNCTIKWTVEDFDKPDHFNDSDRFSFRIIHHAEEGERQIRTDKDTDSWCTLQKLYPDRSNTVYVYAIYQSNRLEPPGRIELTPYKPTNLKLTETPTEIHVKWKRPEFTDNLQVQYLVTCDEKEDKKTYETESKIIGLVPCKPYTIKIFTMINLMKSQPLVGNVTTPLDKPTNFKHTETPTEIVVEWERPEFTGNQRVQYLVTCDEKKDEETYETKSKIIGLVPGKTYTIEIFSIFKSMKSQPLVGKVTTPLVQQNAFCYNVQVVSEKLPDQDHSGKHKSKNAVDAV